MKKYIIPIILVLMVMVGIVMKLAGNKRELDEAKQPVDRTKIPVSVKVTKVEKKSLERQTHYPATTQPYETAKVYSQASGIINRLNIELGSRVAKGQVVGKLDTRILDLNLRDANIALEKAKDDYERAKDLYANEAGLKVDMLNAKTGFEKAQNQVNLIEQQIQNSIITSPITGIISAHTVKEGEFINPGTPIASVTDISLLKTTVYVIQETGYQLEPKQTATITSPVFGDEEFTGEIIYISPVADANHNFQIDMLVHQKEGIHLKGGTDVQVSFNTLQQKDVLQIPKSALMTDTEEPYVFAVENEKAVIKIVKPGVIKRDQVEIRDGLQEGETIITTGQINLKNGSKLNIIN